MFCYNNKMLGPVNKTFGCCAKIFGFNNKNFICCPQFCRRNKTIFSVWVIFGCAGTRCVNVIDSHLNSRFQFFGRDFSSLLHKSWIIFYGVREVFTVTPLSIMKRLLWLCNSWSFPLPLFCRNLELSLYLFFYSCLSIYSKEPLHNSRAGFQSGMSFVLLVNIRLYWISLNGCSNTNWWEPAGDLKILQPQPKLDPRRPNQNRVKIK